MKHLLISTADLADRYTILLLKRNNGIAVDENLDQYKDLLRDVDYRHLHWINEVMWHVEEQMSTESDLRKIGVCAVVLRCMNLLRVRAKNEIAQQHDEAVERKSYG